MIIQAGKVMVFKIIMTIRNEFETYEY